MRTAGWITLLSMLIALPAAGQEISNLKLYRQSVEAAATAVERFGGVEDPVELQRVADIGYRLAVQSSYQEFPFSFYLVDMAAPNAFALPGGHIFVTSGMLALGLTDDMLACLLGHEIAHVTERHGTRMQKRAMWLNILSQAALLGVLIGASDEPENPNDPYRYQTSRKGSLVQGTAAAGLAISELLLRNYSRDFEDEADEEGQRLAAAAGYDPDGARQLWELMNRRIPQSREYGYWRTHPFSDSRQNAAQVRAAELKIQEGRPPEDYRARTQRVILDYGENENEEPELESFLRLSALTAWPQGPKAEELRLQDLHQRRDLLIAAKELERDYGELIREYRVQIEEVRRLTPGTAFLATLEKEMSGLQDEVEALYSKALEVWEEGIFATPFLETFASNYPTAEIIPAVALALGNSYSRLGRQADAVSQYLRAAEAGPETEAGQRALTGLRNLAPVLDELTALQQLADRATDGDLHDPVLQESATKRLAEVVGSYDEIAYGADYLRRYPDGEHATAVGERLEILARNLYGEVVLYQGVGDHVKALERIQLILTHAPQSQAAENLRDRAVVDS